MNDNENIRKAIQILEIAVLNTLYKKYPIAVGPSYISKKTGIPRVGGKLNGKTIRNDGLVESLLYKLGKEGKVERAEQPNGKGGWIFYKRSQLGEND